MKPKLSLIRPAVAINAIERPKLLYGIPELKLMKVPAIVIPSDDEVRYIAREDDHKFTSHWFRRHIKVC